jgi:hypothetical protein
MLNKEGAIAAIPLLREVLALMPDHDEANYRLGEALLFEGNETGIKHIEKALEKQVHGIPSGCDLIIEFLAARGRDAEADKYRDRAGNYWDEVKLGQNERQNISKRDKFEPHGLSGEALDELREQFANFPLLSSALLVRKVCKHFPQDPCFVLGVMSRRILGLQLDSRDQKLIEQVAENVKLPDYTYIIPLERNYKRLRSIFKRNDGSAIYRRS